MALISCPECNKQVSDTAISCPGCGYAIKNHFEKEKILQNQQNQQNNKEQNLSELYKQEAIKGKKPILFSFGTNTIFLVIFVIALVTILPKIKASFELASLMKNNIISILLETIEIIIILDWWHLFIIAISFILWMIISTAEYNKKLKIYYNK